ncbi:branched-chain amino acid ABC transporter permease [Streptomyces sp. NPDC055400]
MTSYILAGLVGGSVYALAALGLVSTYLAAGVLNFAFGAYAYFAARLFYFLAVEQGWNTATAAAVVVLLVSPAIGAVLWALIFRRLADGSALVKVAVTIGLAVALPPLAQLLFGVQDIVSVPGVTPAGLDGVTLLGLSVSANQLVVLGALVLVLCAGGALLRSTRAGLVVRATVDNEEMTALTGVDPQRVGVAVWGVSFLLSGMAGVLVAPTLGLDSPQNFTVLIATAFTAVVLARLRRPGRAAIAALLMGVAISLVQWGVPEDGDLPRRVAIAVPFLFILVFLLFGTRGAQAQGGDTGDDLRRLGVRLASTQERAGRGRAGMPAVRLRALAALVLFGAAVPLLEPLWIDQLALGVGFAIVFLSIVLVTGDGGLISLAQITFAGLGALTMGELTTGQGWPPLLALCAAAIAGLLVGALVGAVTARLGGLYVALITLTVGLLADNLVFRADRFYAAGFGVDVARPGWAEGGLPFLYFALAVFLLAAAYLAYLRHTTTGRAIVAARWSEPAARVLGLSTTGIRTLVVAVGGGVAALGGAVIAMQQQASLTDAFATQVGLIWLTVVVAIGIRSLSGALLAGLSFTVIPQLVVTYLPPSWTGLPVLLFGLAAIGIVRQPDGIVADASRSLDALTDRLRPPRNRVTTPSEPKQAVTR